MGFFLETPDNSRRRLAGRRAIPCERPYREKRTRRCWVQTRSTGSLWHRGEGTGLAAKSARSIARDVLQAWLPGTCRVCGWRAWAVRAPAPALFSLFLGGGCTSPSVVPREQ